MKFYHYVQMFGENSGHWYTIGDEYRSLEEANQYLEQCSDVDPLRIVSYPESQGPIRDKQYPSRLVD